MMVLTQPLSLGRRPLIDLIATHVYTQLHDLHTKLKIQRKTENPCQSGIRVRTADAKLSLCEAACLLILFQASGTSNFMKFLNWNRPILLRLFPTLPSYPNIMKAFKRTESLMLELAHDTLAEPSRVVRVEVGRCRLGIQPSFVAPKATSDAETGQNQSRIRHAARRGG
jgi:hypothetical protein